MASHPDDLYERDFYAWTREQVIQLRRLAATRPNVPVDFPHLLEEVEDLGRSERDLVRSHLRLIIEHLLKLEHSPAEPARRGWHETVLRSRTLIEDKLSASLRRDLTRRLPRLYMQARRDTGAALRLYGEHAAAEALPETCPYRLADLLRHDWLPASRHGLAP